MNLNLVFHTGEREDSLLGLRVQDFEAFLTENIL